ncbi:2-oxo acid dehydrogenase subunit E2, partial [Candidatus Woesearchaeota archaeon]|nr:2-oxo acid dehydrogenase subunit E2 [Candidatus Woesearchaeota archaeon]
MPYEFKFPDVGEGIHEGEIVKWLVKEGDKIKADEPLGEIETDKAIVEMPSPKSGKILKLHVKAGGIIHVGETMVTILEEHETEADAKRHMEQKEKSDVPYTGSVVGFVEEATKVSPIYGKPKTSASISGGVDGGGVGSAIQATPAV